MEDRKLMSGNEAVARGAYEAGVVVSAAYPGTPSTQISESMAQYQEIYCEWSVNEKTALETAYGACVAGVRAIASMKHVGLNVAADALYSIAYTGVNAGLVIVVADDPGMHSSQNEQNTRLIAKAAHVPVLEPANSQEAKDYTRFAFWISEVYDVPVIVRLTTRIAHGASIITLDEPIQSQRRSYAKQPQKYVLLPAYARENKKKAKVNLNQLSLDSSCFWINQEESGSKKLGIITSGITYQYVKEALPEASILKLGLVYPVSMSLVRSFANQVDTLYVVEELEPYLETELRGQGIQIIHKDQLTDIGEYNSLMIKDAFDSKHSGIEINRGTDQTRKDIPARPPLLCPGCPHRGVFEVINKLGLHTAGDIGCYTLGAMPPYEAMDTALCMGAGISMLHGIEKASKGIDAGRWVAVIGDSTFFHTGMNALLNLAYNQSYATVLILDNQTTGMTGHQDHPGTGYTLRKESVAQVSIEAVCRGFGITDVTTVDAYNLPEIELQLTRALRQKTLSVIIIQSICILKKKAMGKKEE